MGFHTCKISKSMQGILIKIINEEVILNLLWYRAYSGGLGVICALNKYTF